MNRLTMERHQVWFYLCAILAGLVTGAVLPAIIPVLEGLLWPVLIVLLYTTFVQVPLWHVRESFRDHRFVGAVLTGNFVLLPLLAWGLIQFLPADPALRLGVLLVLLVPCTDWFITFCLLGGGDAPRTLAITPLNLLLQLVLLPVYLWLMAGSGITIAVSPGDDWPAVFVVLVPLVLAALTERWMEFRPARQVWRDRLAWGPVPLLALVVFLIAAAHIQEVINAVGVLVIVAPLFVVFLLMAALIAKLLATILHLPTTQARTLAFSLGTRNSFVVLPVALALPSGWEIAAIVIVCQSLIELGGMVFYLWWMPHLFKEPTGGH
ncbi:MAG: arsenic resistance protein [Pseudomonadota bacterium]